MTMTLQMALHVTQVLYQPLFVKVNVFLISHYRSALQLWISISLLMPLMFLEVVHNQSPL